MGKGRNSQPHAVPLKRKRTDEDSAGENKTSIKASDQKSRYNKRIQGAEVRVQLKVLAVSKISEKTASFSADVAFTQSWEDNRLFHVNSELNCSFPNISLGLGMMSDMWLPNVCFVNSKSTLLHQSPTPNILLLLLPNGTVVMTYRMRLEAPCNMDLTLFPMDIQQCDVVFESYSFNVAKLRLAWSNHNPVRSNLISKSLDYNLFSVRWGKQQFQYAAGQWDQLYVSFHFSRSVGYYILEVFLHTYTLVFVSWISFWLDPRVLSARMSLGVSSLVAITVQYGTIADSLPKVSYLRAIDVWMFGCTAFIFLTLIELAIVSFVGRIEMQERISGKQTATALMKGFLAPVTKVRSVYETDDEHKDPLGLSSILRLSIGNQPSENFFSGQTTTIPFPERFQMKSGHGVDKISQFLFPSAFIAFNAVYWGYYSVQFKNAAQKAMDQHSE